MTSKIHLLRRGKGKRISPFVKGDEGGFEFFLFRHCEERPVRRGNLCHPICHSNESGVFSRTK